MHICIHAYACMLGRFSHVRLCNPLDCSLSGSSFHGILQARILEWVAVPSTWYACHRCSVASVMFNSWQPQGLQPPRLLCPWDSPGKNTAVGCHALFQGIFLTQGSNLSMSLMSPALAGRFFTINTTWASSSLGHSNRLLPGVSFWLVLTDLSQAFS